jgi:steroid delta-isomerase-like uncharacterized protein
MIGDGTMSEQENTRIVRKVFDDLNNHNLDASEQYMARDVRVEAPGASSTLNKDQGRKYTQLFIDAFPDIHFDLKDVIAQGEKVAVSWIARGTHKAMLTSLDGNTIPATNQKVNVPGCTMFELKNNMIIRQEIYWDQLVFLTQLGIRMDQLSSRAR